MEIHPAPFRYIRDAEAAEDDDATKGKIRKMVILDYINRFGFVTEGMLHKLLFPEDDKTSRLR